GRGVGGGGVAAGGGGWLGTLVILVALARPAAGAPFPAATYDTWIEVKSARFTIYSNAGEPAAVRAARHLERLAEVLRTTTSGLRVDGGPEVCVNLFRDLDSFAADSRKADKAATGWRERSPRLTAGRRSISRSRPTSRLPGSRPARAPMAAGEPCRPMW